MRNLNFSPISGASLTKYLAKYSARLLAERARNVKPSEVKAAARAIRELARQHLQLPDYPVETYRITIQVPVSGQSIKIELVRA